MALRDSDQLWIFLVFSLIVYIYIHHIHNIKQHHIPIFVPTFHYYHDYY